MKGIDLSKYPSNYVDSYKYLQDRLPDCLKEIKMAIVCGSGLNNLANNIQGEKKVFDYKEIPGFAQSTVIGHSGKLVFGFLSEVPVVCMVGRFHFYEGHSAQKVSFPIRIFKMFGAKVLFLTNAAGGLNPNFKTGDLMIIRDHISFLNFTGSNPLIGKNLDVFGERFPPMLNTYSHRLSHMFVKAANECQCQDLKEGTYICLSGPSYETPAEARFFSTIGDVVGMSTAPEATVASHCGLEVVGISLVTNMVNKERALSAFKSPEELEAESYKSPTISHLEVIEVGNKKAKILEKIVGKFVEMLDNQGFFDENITSNPKNPLQQDEEEKINKKNKAN